MRGKSRNQARIRAGVSTGCALLTLVAVLGAICAVQADTPVTFTYQGILTDPNGHLATGEYNMRFSIYPAATGGTPLWTELHDYNSQKVVVTGGLFEVLLGQFVDIDPTLLPGDGSTPYLEVQVEAEVLSPRKPLNSVPYALLAGQPGAGGNTLDEAYDEGGPGAGRVICADAGPVLIDCADGLAVSGSVSVGDDLSVNDRAYVNRSLAVGSYALGLEGSVYITQQQVSIGGWNLYVEKESHVGSLSLRFDYNSGWQSIDPNQVRVFNHDLGGTPSDYIVIMDGKSSNGGIHQANFGTGYSGINQWIGCEWYDLTGSSIRVKRGNNDTATSPTKDWSQVRVRIIKNNQYPDIP
ncbi:MAG: hypothetical protein FJY75_06475 [Candidatus Eisenbacteria bacterium]|uniref:Uncharacterized protein n=1 Tax=Eiseniibacteriota bacterium TaxID=2212470 RepID=A0A937XAV3_UNCEI|nr:hypothetical protein [Candidatus Eisenbacteria bacterium]